MKRMKRVISVFLMIALLLSFAGTVTIAEDSDNIQTSVVVFGVEHTANTSVNINKGESVTFTITVSLPNVLQNTKNVSQILCKIRFYNSVVFTISIPQGKTTTIPPRLMLRI